MTIYIDVILLENIFMNYIILYATAIITKIKPNPVRILISSVIGAVYAVITVLRIFEFYSSIIFKVLISFLLVYIAFETKNVKSLLKYVLLFYLTSFTFGGVAFALLYFIKPEQILIKNGIYIGTYPIKIALIGGVVGFVIITFAFHIIKRKIQAKDVFCDISVILKEKTTELKALIDTGNFLKEPITGAPVVVIEEVSLREILPDILLNNTKAIIEGKMDELNLPDEYLARLRVIPFSSIGKQNGMLLGVKVDGINVYSDEITKTIKNAIVGIYEGNLTKDGRYRALINLEMLEESEENESIKYVKI